MNKLKSCPFCGKKPKFYETESVTNWNHKEKGVLPEMKSRQSHTIECENLECPVRPRIFRIESNDAIELWNTRFK